MSGNRIILTGLVLAAACAAISAHQASSATSAGCPAFYIVDSRGSGVKSTKQLSPGGAAFLRTFEGLARPRTVEVKTNPYPAVGILPTLNEIITSASLSPSSILTHARLIQHTLNGVGALARIGRIGAYHDSVVDGETDLKKMIETKVSACGSTQIVLTGYSQGAQVTGDVYQSLSPGLRAHILGVVLFGDPRYNHASFAGMAKRDNNGILPVRAEFPTGSRGKVLSYCHGQDPVCQGLGQFVLHLAGAHTTYGTTTEPAQAAKLIWALAGKQTPMGVAPSPVTPPTITGQRNLEGVALGLVGNVVSVGTGSWSGSPTGFAYKWYRCDSPPEERQYNDCTPIAGATSSNYTLAEADLGHSIQVKVMASNASGTVWALGLSHTAYGDWPGVIGNIGAPNPVKNDFYSDIGGTPCGNGCVKNNLPQGTVLTAHPGSWDAQGGPSNITFSYQWQSCKNEDNTDCTVIPGATSATYVVTGQYGGWLDVIVHGSNQYGANGIYYG